LLGRDDGAGSLVLDLQSIALVYPSSFPHYVRLLSKGNES
jgi:hypothetical protein